MNKIYKGVIEITVKCTAQDWIIDINLGSIYNMNKFSKPEFLDMFEALEKLGYVEEYKEPVNNFQFEQVFINEFLPCMICRVKMKCAHSETCKNCKFFKNLLEQENDAYSIKSTEEINSKIIELIKSL